MSIASEITSIGENLKKDYQSIANLGADLTNVDKNIENIAELLDGVYDVLPKTEYQEGTEVTLSNTLKGKLDFDNGVVGIGQTEQESTQGYNFANLNGMNTTTNNGVTFTINKENGLTKSVKINGTSVNYDSYCIGTAYLLPAGTYVVYGNGVTNNIITQIVNDTQTAQLGYSGKDDNTMTLEQDTNIIIRLRVTVGATINNIEVKPIIATTSGKTFEPYTGGYASPSPNWKQQVKCVAGRNKWGGFEYTRTFQNITLTFKYNNDGTFIVNGSNTSGSNQNSMPANIVLANNYYKKLSRGTHTIQGGTSNITLQAISITDNSEVSILASSFNGESASFTLNETTKVYLRVQVATGTSFNNEKVYAMLEEGTQATPYLPYNTIEEVVSGKNLVPFPYSSQAGLISGVNWSVNADGTINANGTADNTSSIFYLCNGDDDLYLDPGTYKISTNVFTDANGFGIQAIQMVNGSYGTVYFNDMVLTERTRLRVRILAKANAVVNKTNGYLMIERGNQATAYEPYKTPKTYQFSLGDHKFYGIGTYRDYILRTTGKNKASVELEGKYREFNHGTIQTNEDFDGYIVDVQPNTTYISSGVGLSTNRARMSNLCFFNKDMGYISGLAYNDGATTFTTPNNCYYATIAVNKAITNFQVEEGSTATDYEPYGVGVWYKYGEIGEVQFANVNNIYQEAIFGVNKKYFFQTISTAKSLGNPSYNFLCEILSKSNGVANDYSGFFNGTNIVVLVNDSDTKETATSKYTGKTLHYVLSNPTIDIITGTLAEQLEEWWNGQTLNGTTIITSNGNLPLVIKVRGLKGE